MEKQIDTDQRDPIKDRGDAAVTVTGPKAELHWECVGGGWAARGC